MQKIELVKKKIFNSCDADLNGWLNLWRLKDYKIVFTNGCFDILHLGHVDYLLKAAQLGDVLVLGLNSDSSVKKIKDTNRPIIDEVSRATTLAAMTYIDAVVLFDEDTPYNLIKNIQPDVLVKGADYKPEDIVGYDIVTAKGGKVETIDFLEGYSTTAIVDKIARSLRNL